MDKETLKEALRILGSKGGKANTPAQQAARAKPKKGAGRPKAKRKARDV